jgi:hypothetical protein
MQVPQEIKEAGGRRSVCGVFEDRTRRLKVPAPITAGMDTGPRSC